jgi:hypothetical protein
MFKSTGMRLFSKIQQRAMMVDQKVRPELEQAIQDVLGSNQAAESYLSFKLDEQTHSPVLTFRYPTNEPERPGYVHPQVKLELRSLTDQQPNEERPHMLADAHDRGLYCGITKGFYRMRQ